MSLTEYDEEEAFRNFYEDRLEQGTLAKAIEDAIMLVKDYNATPETAAQKK